MDQFGRLLALCLDDARMAVAHVVHGDACHEVQVLFAVGIPDMCLASAHKDYILAAVGLKYGFRFPFFQVIFVDHKIDSIHANLLTLCSSMK